MRNKTFIFVIVLLLAIGFSAIATASGLKVPVKVVQVQRGSVEVNQLVNGVIEPQKNISVSSKTGGFIQEMKVEIGQFVKANQTLVVFEQDQILIQIKQAEAAVEVAKANLDLLSKGASEEDKKAVQAAVNQAQISYNSALKNLEFANAMMNDRNMQLQQLKAAELQVENAAYQHSMASDRAKQAEIAFEQASIDYQRMLELYNNQVITAKQLDGAKLQLVSAESNYNTAKTAVDQAVLAKNAAVESLTIVQEIYDNRRTAEQQVEAAKTQLELSKVGLQVAENNLQKVLNGANPDQIRVSKASVKQAEAALELARLQLDNCILKSPISGIVAAVNADPGEMVGPGVPVLIIIAVDTVYAKADVTADLLQSLQIGDLVKVNIHGLNAEKQGILEQIAPMADPRTQAFAIKVALENKANTIRPGMFVDVRLILRQSKDTIIVPVESVQSLDFNPYVFIIKDGKALKRTIQVGLTNNRQVEVLKGLEAGEQIAIRGQYTLKDGDLVEVVK